MYRPNLKSVALPVREIMGYSKTLGSSWLRPRSLFSKIFNGLLFGWTLSMYRPNLNSVALPLPEIIGVLKYPLLYQEQVKQRAVPGYAVQGHPRSLILVPIERAYAVCDLVTLVLSCTVSDLLQVFSASE